MAITLRTLADNDLDTLFVSESDPRAVQMAAFTRADPSDRTATHTTSASATTGRARCERSTTTASSWGP
jgi:hypothetical protein